MCLAEWCVVSKLTTLTFFLIRSHTHSAYSDFRLLYGFRFGMAYTYMPQSKLTALTNAVAFTFAFAFAFNGVHLRHHYYYLAQTFVYTYIIPFVVVKYFVVVVVRMKC